MTWLALALFACKQDPVPTTDSPTDTGTSGCSDTAAPTAPEVLVLQPLRDVTSVAWLPSSDDCTEEIQYELLVDDQVVANVTGEFASLEGIASGEHTLSVVAVDEVGERSASEPVDFTVQDDAFVEYIDQPPVDLSGKTLSWTGDDTFEAEDPSALSVGAFVIAPGPDLSHGLWEVTALSGSAVTVTPGDPTQVVSDLSIPALVVRPIAVPDSLGTWSEAEEGFETRTVVLAEGRVVLHETRQVVEGRPPSAANAPIEVSLDGAATLTGDLSFPSELPISGRYSLFGTSWFRAEPSAGATFSVEATVNAEAAISADTEVEVYDARWSFLVGSVPIRLDSSLTAAFEAELAGAIDAGVSASATAGVKGTVAWDEEDGAEFTVEPFTETSQDAWLTATATAEASATLLALQEVSLYWGLVSAEVEAEAVLAAHLSAEASTEASCPLETELTGFTVDLDTEVRLTPEIASLDIAELTLHEQEPEVLFSLPSFDFDCPTNLELDTDTACGVSITDGVNNPLDTSTLAWSTESALLSITGSGEEVTLFASDAGDATLQVTAEDSVLGSIAGQCEQHDLSIGLVACDPWVGDVSSAYTDVCDGCGTRALAGSLDLSDATDSDVASLACLTSISGDLTMDSSAVTSLSGLEGVTTVGGGLDFYGNSALTDVGGLSGLTSVGDTFYFANNDAVVDFTGLESLARIDGRLYIQLNDSMTSLAGLDGLKRFETSLSIGHNAVLSDLTDLHGATFAGSYFFVFNNTCLTTAAAWDLHSALGSPAGPDISGNTGPC